MFKNTIFVLLLLFFGGCTTSSGPTTHDFQPKWLYNPGISGKIGGVGSARVHLKGKSAQRTLAISRALDEIAAQMGVKVSTILASKTNIGGASVSSGMQTYSFQTTDGTIVKAKIKEMWYENEKDVLHVWMVVE